MPKCVGHVVGRIEAGKDRVSGLDQDADAAGSAVRYVNPMK